MVISATGVVVPFTLAQPAPAAPVERNLIHDVAIFSAQYGEIFAIARIGHDYEPAVRAQNFCNAWPAI